MEGDFELEKIRQEIAQEKQMKEMLEQSAAELRATVEELENRYDTIDNEGNEWKTRYETQTEINEQLERQILNLQNKVQEAKSNLKDEDEKEKENDSKKKSSPRQNKPKSERLHSVPVRKQGTQKASPRKSNSLERPKKKAPTAAEDFYPDGRVRPFRRIVGHRTVRTKAGRNLQSRSSMMSNSNQGPGSVNDSKPGSASTKSTGITINIAISPREAGKTPRDMNRFDDLSDANPHMIRMLEKEKQMLSSQLRDLEWRLDQESKAYHKANDERRNFQSEIKSTKKYQAYHKANDERKSYNLEISNTKHQQSEFTSRQRMAGSREQLDNISGPRTPRDLSRPTTKGQNKEGISTLQRKSYASSRLNLNRGPVLTLRRRNSRKSGSQGSLSNIPEDQRIIDPKRGPIKKTAGVKNLPSLDMT